MPFEATFDPDTKAWFDRNPDAQTTVMKCERCGLYYKPILGHRSKNCKVRNATEEKPKGEKRVEKRCVIKTEGIAGIKAARNAAIKDCIHKDRDLYEELLTMLPEKVTTLHYNSAVEELILKRHIRSIVEHPVARVGGKGSYGKYVIDVYHTIVWEDD
jgi:hypothetical protein